MRRRGRRVGHLHVECPFCGRLCDRTSPMTWCGGCYCEWRLERGAAVFDQAQRTPRFAWAKALARAGGAQIGSGPVEGQS